MQPQTQADMFEQRVLSLPPEKISNKGSLGLLFQVVCSSLPSAM